MVCVRVVMRCGVTEGWTTTAATGDSFRDGGGGGGGGGGMMMVLVLVLVMMVMVVVVSVVVVSVSVSVMAATGESVGGEEK